MQKYTYTIFVKKSMYWKSFNTMKQAKAEAKRLKKDGVTGIRINKERDD